LEANVQSRACGHFFMGWMPKDNEPICLNEVFYVGTNILKFVVASAADVELGALYHNCQKGIVFQKILIDVGHPQPKNPVHCDYATAVGIVYNTVKQQHSCSMEIRFFGVYDKCSQDMYTLSWHPGQENLADYQSKHHLGAQHTAVCAWYLHMENSTHFLPRAKAPSVLKGCVGTLNDRYLHKVPLPRAPRIQSTNHVTCHIQITRDNTNTCYSQVSGIPT
jgi:hypothetical protein